MNAISYRAMDFKLWATTELLPCSITLALIYILSLTGAKGITFNFQNDCKYTVWPGLLPNGGSTLLEDGGFELEVGETRTLDAPAGWSGRFWGRTGCSFSSLPSPPSAIACTTGDCGNGRLQCGGNGASPPATLAEITLAGNQPSTKMDFYDVSLVDGYNIPVAIAPSVTNSSTSSASNSQQHTSAAAATNKYVCETAGCIADLNTICPQELEVLASKTTIAGSADTSPVVGCKSACDAFLSPEYCCTGSYSNPDTCKPTSYSELFKQACPRAYSYAFDDATSTFTCTASEYSIIFCPTSLSQKSSAANVSDHIGARMIIGFWWAGFLGLIVLDMFVLFC